MLEKFLGRNTQTTEGKGRQQLVEINESHKIKFN